ncbi:PREDICTED: tetratricopeptide repeat protein 9C-like [Priapulus caudatus]|uniref:Tetratricopeptide repeat protein 9C-like n=1 Tax=Priapulus caudatus TaxID=37621 RepID=A0ABM1EC70_PRICU|nr:PREDICTED: tetratricopeptide repeat protein 9C-like [Priapulus caudatus]XP_014669791.1 PREDICTED: tetratricopeptide repeat protein 9C-like [Priapulus caudatus]XP_014669792.1 PREDICTED: tetratricopeptide repeat protein 9C-like [Priapulus caudatus]
MAEAATSLQGDMAGSPDHCDISGDVTSNRNQQSLEDEKEKIDAVVSEDIGICEGTSAGVSKSNDVDEKIHKAEEYKTAGNTLYKEKNYRSAAGKYHRALLYLKALTCKNPIYSMSPELSKTNNDGLSEQQEMKISLLSVDCYNNLAAAVAPISLANKV